MNITTKTLFAMTLISTAFLTACNSVGNVVPKSGPTMEQVYDNMGKSKDMTNAQKESLTSLKTARQEVQSTTRTTPPPKDTKLVSGSLQGFHQVPNPMLHLYIYPHLSGADQLPVPGYGTAFNAYDKDHWDVYN